ncbi:hypothetical protein ScPMuIL_013018 [Solemya velum]
MGMQPVVAQPGINHQTTVVVNQIPAPDPRYKQQRLWSSGTCACFDDCESCVLATVFPCYPMVLASRMGENACVPLCVPNAMTAMRTKIRIENGIMGSICDDCLMATFCGPCALCQMKREMDYIEQIRP